jgi:hypothetical protein
MYFVLLTVEKLTGFHNRSGIVATPLKWLYTMVFVILGWVLFRSETLTGALHYIKSMFFLAGSPVFDGMFTGYLKQNAILLVIGIVLCTPVAHFLKERLKPSLFLDILSAVGLIALFILSVASLVSSTYNPFIYFNF